MGQKNLQMKVKIVQKNMNKVLIMKNKATIQKKIYGSSYENEATETEEEEDVLQPYDDENDGWYGGPKDSAVHVLLKKTGLLTRNMIMKMKEDNYQ